jgi:hypothetical protein
MTVMPDTAPSDAASEEIETATTDADLAFEPEKAPTEPAAMEPALSEPTAMEPMEPSAPWRRWLELIWFTVAVTGRRLPVAAIAVAWVAVMVIASTRTGEGDLVLTDNNWVGIVTMLAGSLTFAVAGYRLVLTAFHPKL